MFLFSFRMFWVSSFRVWMAGLVLGSLGLQAAKQGPGQSLEAARQHWAYQPLRTAVPPRVRSSEQLITPIDAFLLSRLESEGMTFAPPAEPRIWLRRVYYDLIGLPPTFEELEAFAANPSQQTRAQVVDRLLSNPRYGERWGRHWLDVARYADTKDLVLLYGRDALRPYAYTYRDYVIRAFNQDLPFHEFIRDQLAADLIQPQGPPWRLAALGFLTLGRMFDNNPHDQIDDQIDTIGRGLLGLTVACARCHDHKFDAITMADYYGLYGVFASTERPYVLPLIENPSEVTEGVQFEERLGKARQELEDHISAEYTKLTEVMRGRFGDYLLRAATTPPDLSETTQFGLSLTPEDFRPALMLRMRRFLEQRVRPEDRLFGPWSVLMTLEDSGFAAAQSQLLAQANPRWNPVVVAALQKAALKRREEVPKVYAQLFNTLYQRSRPSKEAGAAPVLSVEERECVEVVTASDSPVAFSRRETPNHMSRPDKDRYGGLVLTLDKIAAHATNRPPARAMVVSELPEPYSPRIFQRGNPSRPGDPVSRGFLRVLSQGKERPFREGSGRRELAEAIGSENNPLTARVFVNRAWMLHFGEPLVASTADFGVRSDPPTHPELLDWLASDFIRSGWSVKHLHRVLVLSRAYAQSSAVASGESSKSDAISRLLGRYPRRRLDLESMRDTLLFVSGRLDSAVGGPPVEIAADPFNARRTVYGLVDRQNLPGLFRSFDFAPPDQCSERRPKTTVPQQALFALNSSFVQEQARALARSPEIPPSAGPADRVLRMYRQVLGRNPSEREARLALDFVTATPVPGSGLTHWEQLAQVLLVSNESVFLD